MSFTDRIVMMEAPFEVWREARQFFPGPVIADGPRRLMRIVGSDYYQWQEQKGAWTWENVGPLLRRD